MSLNNLDCTSYRKLLSQRKDFYTHFLYRTV
uniref:Uncharacterized protein n=1 Tax=Podoviridae sp. ctG4L18 TaxID=2825234 RepID=A0A8S5UNZ4_9CAUD|nr:MAG TPA: hypothetical protein [Podoviridae sp. ctG4L18]